MARRMLRIAAWLVVASVLLVVAAGGLLVWQIRREPLRLGVLVPRVEAALASDGELTVHLAGLELAWNGEEHHLELRAHGVRVLGGAGSAAVTLDAIALRLRKGALLRGQIVITAIELSAPRLELSRRADGAMFVLPEGASPGSSPGLDLLGTVLAKVESVALRDGSAVFVDERTRTRWALPHVAGSVWRDGGAIRLQADVTAVAGEARLPVWVEGVLRPNGTFDVQATSPGAATADALGFWPGEAAPDARAWVTRHVTEGRVHDLQLGLHGARPSTDAAPALVALDATCGFEDLVVRYVDTMPPVGAVRGTAHFTLDGADFSVEGGRLEALAVGTSSVRIVWPENEPNRIAIETRADGPLASALQVLAAEPVSLGAPLGGVQGRVAARVRFAFPLEGRHRLSDLGLSLTGTVSDAAIPNVVGDWGVTNGAVAVTADDRSMTLDGTAMLRGVPLKVRWEDRFSDPAGSWIALTAALDDAGRAALGLDTRDWLTGAVATSVRVRHDASGQRVADVEADLTAATVALPPLAVSKAAGERGSFTGRLVLRGGLVAAIDDAEIDIGGATVRGSAARSEDGGAWSRVHAEATLAPSAEGETPAFTVSMRADADAWHAQIDSADLGALLRAYGVETVRGGTMRFDGTVDPHSEGVPWRGKLTADRFSVTRVSWFIRMVQLASLKGMLDFTDDSASIDRLVATVAGRAQTVEVEDLVAEGPKLALGLKGTADRGSDTVDLEGTLTPSYLLLNDAMNRIPLIGGLFAPEADGGVQGFAFSVRGPRRDPSIRVNPISSLAPGVLREWMRKLGL